LKNNDSVVVRGWEILRSRKILG